MNSRKAKSNRRGVITVMVAVLLVVLMSAAALAVDLGRLFFERRTMQSASDAAAEAGAIELSTSGDVAAAIAAAQYVAAKFGYMKSPAAVLVNIPPKSGEFAGQTGYVEVDIKSAVSRSFSAVLASGDLGTASHSVAAGTTTPSKASVLILDPKRKDSLKLKGKGSSLQCEGDIVVNSKDKRSIQVASKSQLNADHLLLTGGIDKKSRGLIEATVQTGVAATPDPFASLPAPSKGTAREAKDFLTTVDNRQLYSLKPGNYKDLLFDSNDVVTMEPGTYYVSGKFEMKSSSSLLASKVTIFQDGKKGMKFNSTGVISVTPPTSGTYAGISLWQTKEAKAKLEFKGGRNYEIGGVIYCPNGEVKFTKTDLSSCDDEDWESDADAESSLDEDYGTGEKSGMSGSIVARQLTIDKGSHVQLLGADISVRRPIRGLVE